MVELRTTTTGTVECKVKTDFCDINLNSTVYYVT